MSVKQVIVSETGVVHGHGTAPYKWVSGLSDSEMEAVKSGSALVFIRDNASAGHWTQSGYKVVHYGGGKYFHREPSAGQIRAFNNHFRDRGEN
jgi:hypothetical protein